MTAKKYVRTYEGEAKLLEMASFTVSQIQVRTHKFCTLTDEICTDSMSKITLLLCRVGEMREGGSQCERDVILRLYKRPSYYY